MNQVEDAIAALQMAISQKPLYPQAHKRLAYIYANRLNDPMRAAEHRILAIDTKQRLRELKKQRQMEPVHQELAISEARVTSLSDLSRQAAGERLGDDEIVVVSGLPRSGTSMMMQVLQAGGIAVFADDQREADPDNPRGYFEHESVKSLGKDASWLGGARGQAIKVVTQLLPSIPAKAKLRIIYMERDLREILASQDKMLERLDKQGSRQSQGKLADTYSAQVERVKAIIKRRESNIQLRSVNYAEALQDPEAMVKGLNEFFGGSLDTDAMLGAIDPELRRQRIA
jgi:hypothetical protein